MHGSNAIKLFPGWQIIRKTIWNEPETKQEDPQAHNGRRRLQNLDVRDKYFKLCLNSTFKRTRNLLAGHGDQHKHTVICYSLAMCRWEAVPSCFTLWGDVESGDLNKHVHWIEPIGHFQRHRIIYPSMYLRGTINTCQSVVSRGLHIRNILNNNNSVKKSMSLSAINSLSVFYVLKYLRLKRLLRKFDR